jgi:uncharacterized protein (DUF433 family)
MDYREIITIEPGKRSGKPCIRGTRMTVTDVLEYLAGGMTEKEILADFPDLTSDEFERVLRLLPTVDPFNHCHNLMSNLSPFSGLAHMS